MDPVTPVAPAPAMPGDVALPSAVEAVLGGKFERPDFHRMEVQHRSASAHCFGNQSRVALDAHRPRRHPAASLGSPGESPVQAMSAHETGAESGRRELESIGVVAGEGFQNVCIWE